MPQTLTADKIQGKYLHAAKPVKLYGYPEISATILDTIQTGDIVGQVYSWVERSGQVWWQFKFANSGGFFYTPHVQGNFDWSKLKSQFPSGPAKSGGAPDILLVGGAIFSAYMAHRAKSFGSKVVWGGFAALITGKIVVDKVKSIDLNPFD